MRIEYKQLTGWPRALNTGRTSKSPFKKTWDQRVAMLLHEAEKFQPAGLSRSELKERPVVVSLAIEMRVDGSGPRGDRQYLHPGVQVSVLGNSPTPHIFNCDHFTEWRDNLYGVAITMERLRLADLYGVAGGGQQFAGFKMLTGPTIAPPNMNVDQAAAILAKHSGANVSDVLGRHESVEIAYKFAVGKLHPDRGGKPAAWTELQQAKAVMDLFFKHRG